MQSAWDQVQQAPGDRGPAWLRALRERGFQRFRALGWPTLKDEEWRSTNVRPLAQTPFVLARPGDDAPGDSNLRTFALSGDEAARLVFVNGHYRPEASDVGGLPGGALVLGLAEAIHSHGELVRPHLEREPEAGDAFTALNAAFLEDGAFIHIPEGVQVEGLIHVLQVSTASDPPRMSHVRHLIVAGARSRATVIEDSVSLGESSTLSNALTQTVVGPEAHLTHYLLEREHPGAYNISTLHARQEAASDFESHTALLGGGLVRNNVHLELLGEGCDSLINGLFVGRGTQHLDNHMRVVHAAPNCDSRQFYKGILGDKAHGVFSGRIIVRPGAQKTDAKQTSRNLLLSDDARIDARPQLEIYADDVKCTHGATTGRLDEDALFYLRSRGLDAASARRMLILAFAHESVERMHPKVRGLLADRIERQLGGTLGDGGTGGPGD